jgi:hypothetical protein
MVSCLVGNGNVINNILDQRKKQADAMQQAMEAEKTSLVGWPEMLSGLNKYVNIEITHFIIDFLGLNENTTKLFDSNVIKKLQNIVA